MNKLDAMGKEAICHMEELVNAGKMHHLMKKQEEADKKRNTVLWVLAIIGVIAAVACIAYAVYRFFTPDYLDDFEDDFDDDFDDDFFEDGKEPEPASEPEPEVATAE